jgi:hypothetical protein
VFTLNLDGLGAGWNIRDGIERLRRAITTTESKLVVFDALLDHMPPAAAGETINSPTFVRGALGPLKQLVRELDIVAIVSLHPPKARGFAFRDFVQGSQAFSAVSRFGLLFAWHPDDAEDDPLRRRVMVRGKGNLGRDPGALEFRVIGREHEHSDGHVQEREVVVDVRSSDVTFQQPMARPRGAGDERHRKYEDAAEIIQSRLNGGEWHPAATIRGELDAQDLNSDSVVDNAKRLLGVATRRGVDGWEWRIPLENPAKNPPPPIYLATDSWAENTPNPQQPREESKNPPPGRRDSPETAANDGLCTPLCGHSARWWRLPSGRVGPANCAIRRRPEPASHGGRRHESTRLHVHTAHRRRLFRDRCRCRRTPAR